MPRSPAPPERPPIWRLLGYDALLELDPATGRYTACVPALPGCHAEGSDRTRALRALAAAIRAHRLGRVC